MHSYQHAFHAGNYADLIKHLVLITTLYALQKKDKGLLMLDTHAGRGFYDPSKTASGAFALPSLCTLSPTEHTDATRALCTLAETLRQQFQKTLYPGSSTLLAFLKRPQDRLISIEAQGRVFQELHTDITNLGKKPKHHLERGDGYHALKAYLPPPERRGLIFMDPPYDHPQEFRQILDAIEEAQTRFPTGCYVIWYPLVARTFTPFLKSVTTMGWEKILTVHFSAYPDDHPGMYGCGLVIINPPWQLESTLELTLRRVTPLLRQHPSTTFSFHFL